MFRRWWRRRFRGNGLADAESEPSRKTAGSLLIKQRQGDDLGAAALAAPIRCLLLRGYHRFFL
jgi:hypothetical protein